MIVELFGPNGELIMKVPSVLMLNQIACAKVNGDDDALPAGTYVVRCTDANGQQLNDMEVKK